MRILRLLWAGVQIDSGRSTLVIDLLENTLAVKPLLGLSRSPTVPGPESADIALVTHLHPDHYDAEALRNKRRAHAPVFCDPAHASRVERDGFNAVSAAPYDTFTEGSFKITALPAVDGFGDPQISFCIEANGVKVMHFGDTLWHGHWWKIRARCGPPISRSCLSMALLRSSRA